MDVGMGIDNAIALAPILKPDFMAVGQFLHDNLNRRLSAPQWAAAIAPSWPEDAPNHGFLLREGPAIVGVQLAFYSTRLTPNGPMRLCNIAAFCVLPRYRLHSLRLLRAILAQPGYSFTDLSPSGNVVPLNQRLGFRALDTTAALVANPLFLFAPARLRLVSDRAAIEASLTGDALTIFRDHRDARAVEHLLLTGGPQPCHIMFRRDRRKNLPLFATILHVSDPHLFRQGRAQVFRHLLVRHGLPFTLMELRLVQARPLLSLLLAGHRPKMFLSTQLTPEAVDYLYSELTCVAW